MLDRRTRILDAAIAIVGEGGTRSLTHRGVDRRLQLPDGSTSNYFRTREALLDAAVDRLLELDRATLTDIHSGFENLDDAALARGIAEYAVRLCRPGRIVRTRARFALTLVYPDRLGSLLEEWVKLGVESLGAHGIRAPESATKALLAYTDGVMLQAIVASGGDGLELERAEIAANVLTLLSERHSSEQVTG
ncbi:MAG: TetR/AcrR family transcriptional regulator [Beutenbergiaceae bacterium]